MKEIKINKIGNGYTIYCNYKTEFVKTKEEVIEFVKKTIYRGINK